MTIRNQYCGEEEEDDGMIVEEEDNKQRSTVHKVRENCWADFLTVVDVRNRAIPFTSRNFQNQCREIEI